MTLDEAIKHCEDVAEDRCGCAEDCVNEHRQLAEWLRELKAYRVANTPRTDCETCTHYGVVSVSCDRCDKSTHSRYEPQAEQWYYNEQDLTWYPCNHPEEQKMDETIKERLAKNQVESQ